MTEQKPNYALTIIGLVLMAGYCFYASSGGCKPFGGIEFSSWLGKVKMKPIPPQPVVAPPATRCLIFGFDSCPGCRTLKRTTSQMARSNGWRVGPLENDDIEHIDIKGPDERVSKYKHSSYPTLIIVDRQGKEVARKVSVPNADELGEWIRSTRK